MTDPVREALKPCPFCGGRAIWQEQAGSPAVEFTPVYRLNCSECFRIDMPWWTAKSDCIEQWNTRVSAAPGEPCAYVPLSKSPNDAGEPMWRETFSAAYFESGKARWSGYELRAFYTTPQPAAGWECMGRKQSLPEPGECNWPDCGCDPHATKVIESLVEQGWTAPLGTVAQRFETILKSLNYDGDDINSLTVGEIRHLAFYKADAILASLPGLNEEAIRASERGRCIKAVASVAKMYQFSTGEDTFQSSAVKTAEAAIRSLKTERGS